MMGDAALEVVAYFMGNDWPLYAIGGPPPA
jgi:hypothetical protein